MSGIIFPLFDADGIRLTSLRLGPPSAVTYAQHLARRRLSMRFNSPRSDAEFTTAAANLLDYATANMAAGPHPRLAGRDDPDQRQRRLERAGGNALSETGYVQELASGSEGTTVTSSTCSSATSAMGLYARAVTGSINLRRVQ